MNINVKMDLCSKANLSGPSRNFLLLSIFLSVLPLCALSRGNYRLTILYTSDFRSRYGQIDASGADCTRGQVERGECFGGIARLISKVREIRAEGGNVLLLDGGNQFEATPWFAAYREKASVHFMNLTKYDAMAIGYREFDLSPDGLAKYIRQLPFPVLSSNLDITGEPILKDTFVRSTVINVGGENIGIVGYTYGRAATNTHVGAVTFTEEIEAIREQVEQLEDRGVDKVIVIGSSTLSMGKGLAARIPGVDVVIGGGTRSFLYNGDPPSNDEPVGPYPETVGSSQGHTVLIAQTIGFGKYLGRLDVSFDRVGNLKDWSGNPILLGKTTTEDPDILAQVEEWQFDFRGYPIRLGSSHVLLDGARRSCRLMECPLGNVVTDAMVMSSMTPATDNKWTEAPIALMNAGAIRASVPIGNIYTEDMIRILPYRSTVDMMSLQGQYILDALEHAVAEYDAKKLHGKFVQVSGLRVYYDLSKPKGQRVARVYVLCSECLIPRYVPLDVDEVYKVLVSSFMANGGDGFKMIRDNKKDHTPGLLMKDAVRVYVKEHSPLVTPLEGRIRFLSTDDDTHSGKTGERDRGNPRRRRPVLNRDNVNRNEAGCLAESDVYPPHMKATQKD